MPEQTSGVWSGTDAPEGIDYFATAYQRLSAAQAAALRALAAGRSMGDAAAEAGVDRGTLWRWRKQDDDFMEAMTDWREQAQTHSRDRMLAMVDEAIDSVSAGLKQGDARLAFRFLLDLNRVRTTKREVQEAVSPVRKDTPLERGIDAALSKLTPEQLKYFPETLEAIIPVDKARRQLQPGQYIVIEHKWPPGTFVIRSDGTPATDSDDAATAEHEASTASPDVARNQNA